MDGTDTRTDAELVGAAVDGDETAWAAVVTRYQALVDATTRRHRLAAADAADVSQQVWTQLVVHLARLRDPRALPGWIATTTARACLELVRGRRRWVVVDATPGGVLDRGPADGWAGGVSAAGVDDDLLRAERRRAVRAALAELPDRQQQLLALLVADPPIPYREISERMGLPVGSIGPTRTRLLHKLGRTAAIRALTGEPATASTSGPAPVPAVA